MDKMVNKKINSLDFATGKPRKPQIISIDIECLTSNDLDNFIRYMRQLQLSIYDSTRIPIEFIEYGN
jgi:hypothetical protein